MSKNNPMMVGFVREEMTLKTTLLVCDPMVIPIPWFHAS
jgi:hypothetical protein